MCMALTYRSTICTTTVAAACNQAPNKRRESEKDKDVILYEPHGIGIIISIWSSNEFN